MARGDLGVDVLQDLVVVTVVVENKPVNVALPEPYQLVPDRNNTARWEKGGVDSGWNNQITTLIVRRRR